MNIDEYLNAFERYRKTVMRLESAFREVWGEEDAENGSRCLSARWMIGLMDYDELEREYTRKKRILRQATERLQRAISEIPDDKIANYLVCRYLYRMTNEKIADHFNYCPRQIYRIASKAKKQLHRELLKEMPRVKRWKKHKRFRRSPVQRKKRTLRKYGRRARMASSEKKQK